MKKFEHLYFHEELGLKIISLVYTTWSSLLLRQGADREKANICQNEIRQWHIKN